jgi:hypothetical protein
MQRFFLVGAKEKLEEKMLEVKILGHQIRKGLKGKEIFSKILMRNYLFDRNETHS